jgi:hypothetical protein
VTVELFPLVASGLSGGLAMIAIQVVASTSRPGGVFDATGFWSHLLRLPERTEPVAGLLVHLLVSIGVAGGYALGFRAAGVTDTGWAWGLVGGVIHWVVGGTILGVLPTDDSAVHLPGAFARRLGPAGAVGFLAAHLVFGLVTGVVYFILHSEGGINAAL